MLKFFQSSTNEHLVHEEESKQKNLKSSIKKTQTLLTATTLETVSNVLTLQKRVAVGRNLLKSIYSQSRKCQVLRRKTAQVPTLLKKKSMNLRHHEYKLVPTWRVSGWNASPLLECRHGNTDNDKRVQQG